MLVSWGALIFQNIVKERGEAAGFQVAAVISGHQLLKWGHGEEGFWVSDSNSNPGFGFGIQC